MKQAFAGFLWLAPATFLAEPFRCAVGITTDLSILFQLWVGIFLLGAYFQLVSLLVRSLLEVELLSALFNAACALGLLLVAGSCLGATIGLRLSHLLPFYPGAHPAISTAILVVAIICSVVWLWMLVDCAIRETRLAPTVVWILVILLAPLGAFIYLADRKLRIFSPPPPSLPQPLNEVPSPSA